MTATPELLAELEAILKVEPTDEEVKRILAGDYFDYRKPLEAAWKWNRNGPADNYDRARQLTAALLREYPIALRVWFELAFGLVKRKRQDLAFLLLETKVSPVFGNSLDTDTFSLWGRCLKDRGDEYRAAVPPQYALAEAEYENAEKKYEGAYVASGGDRFPGINAATLRLLRAAMLKKSVGASAADATQSRDDANGTEARVAELVAGCKQRAAEVLASRATWWKALPDDDIWMAATEAEAHFLQRNWGTAEERYRAALRPENKPLPHHFQSIGTQLHRLCEAFVALGTPPPPPFDDPAKFLASLLPKTA